MIAVTTDSCCFFLVNHFLVDEVDFYLFCLFLMIRISDGCFVDFNDFDRGDLSELFVTVEVLPG
jgi:hypothetical protein